MYGLLIFLHCCKRRRRTSDDVLQGGLSHSCEIGLRVEHGGVVHEPREVVVLGKNRVELDLLDSHATAAVTDGFTISDEHCTETPSLEGIETRRSENVLADELVDVVLHAMVMDLTWGQVDVGHFLDLPEVIEEFRVRGTSAHDIVSRGACTADALIR